MTESAAARATEQFSEQARKFIKAKENVTEVLNKNLEEGRESARRALRRGREFAEDTLDDTARTIKRHPFESVGATFAIGLLAGTILGLLLRRK